MALLGILVVAAGVVIWKSMDETEPMADKGGSGDKKTSGTDMQVAEKKVSTKTSYKNPAGDDEVGFSLMVNSEGGYSRCYGGYTGYPCCFQDPSIGFFRRFGWSDQGKETERALRYRQGRGIISHYRSI